MVALVTQMYHIIEDFINHIIKLDISPPDKRGSVIVFGGIHINTPDPMEDYFKPIIFEIRKYETPTIDLMDKLKDEVIEVIETVEMKRSDSKPEPIPERRNSICTKKRSHTLVRVLSNIAHDLHAEHNPSQIMRIGSIERASDYVITSTTSKDLFE
jgi:hypothetical protein